MINIIFPPTLDDTFYSKLDLFRLALILHLHDTDEPQIQTALTDIQQILYNFTKSQSKDTTQLLNDLNRVLNTLPDEQRKIVENQIVAEAKKHNITIQSMDLTSLLDVFQDKNWTNFINVYKEEKNKNITDNLNIIRDKIRNIKAPSELKDVQDFLHELPPEQRRVFEPAFVDKAKSLDFDIALRKKEGVSEPLNGAITKKTENSKGPLHIHFQGTEVGTKRGQFATKVRAPNDYLAEQIYDQENFYIQTGVNRYTGSEAKQYVDNIISYIENNQPANNRIVLSGFSRGAAAQIYLANRIHEKFNKDENGKLKPENDWIKIDMFLVDPAYGWLDSATDAATREYVIPRCVNTLNIVYANPLAKVEEWFHNFFTRRAHNTLKSDPAYTTIQTITVNGAHNAVGLMLRNFSQRLSSYFVDALFSNFLKCAGRNTPIDQNELKNLDSHLDKNYIKNNVLAPQQQSTVMQYYSSWAKRLEQNAKTIDSGHQQADANALQFAATMPTYLSNPNPKFTEVHNQIMQIFGAIIKGDYETRFLGGKKYAERKESRLPNHMYKMCERIEQYCNELKASTNTPPDPKDVLIYIQNIAKEATKTSGIGREPQVTQFYSKLNSGQVDEAVSNLISPKLKS